MRHYYTAEEFNNNNKDLLLKDKYYDKWSRDCTNELFRQFGHKLKKQIISLTENPNQTLQDGDIYYDMMATETDFSRIAIECKYRF